ncbi:MAG: NAD-dependent epimerase/dehydratase family protein [Chloroflexia bacterium]
MGASYLEAFAEKKVLITGGLGFIGSNLARRLVELGARVLLVDSLIPSYGGNLFNIHGIEDRVQVNIADVRDEHSMDYLVRGHDLIFNLAGQVSHIDSMQDPYTDLEINCRSQLSILEACRRHNPEVKILYAGTRQQYGRPHYLPVDENHPMHPTDINGVNKMAGEWYHIVYHRAYGLRTCSLRLTNTYGPRMLVRHNRQTALGWFIRLALDDQEIPIWGDGRQLRDYTYVDDVVDAFLRAAASDQTDGQVYNLGGRRPISHLELVETLIAIAGSGRYRLLPWPPERQRIDIGDVYSSYRRIQETLGWEPQVELEEGLRRTVEFYRKYKEKYW